MRQHIEWSVHELTSNTQARLLEPVRLAHHNGVLDRNAVVRQPVDDPRANLHCVAERVDKLESLRARDSAVLALGDPAGDRFLAEAGGERTYSRDRTHKIGDELQYISCLPVTFALQVRVAHKPLPANFNAAPVAALSAICDATASPPALFSLPRVAQYNHIICTVYFEDHYNA